MKKILSLLLIGAMAASLLTGCTMGHTAETIQEAPEEVAEEPTPEPTPEVTEEPAPLETPEPTPEITEEPEIEITEAETVEPEPQEPIPDGMAKSALTGEYVTPETAQRRPIGFVIDNSKAAVPQSGISAAKIMYEAPVEGSYTRLFAVFEDVSGQNRIGPLRSCRDYFLSLTSGLDLIFTHYGQAAYALPYLESDDVDNVSGLLGSTYGCFYRDYTFHSGEHTAYIGADGINKAIDIRGYSRVHDEDFEPMYKFTWVGEEITNEGGEEASYLATGYPYNTPYFVYHPDEGVYYRYQFGEPHIDVENGEQLKTKNIILEYQNYDIYQRQTIEHPVYLHFDTTAGGMGKYITDGKAIDITWERPSFWEPVVYRDMDGNELKINTGTTWVLLIQNEFLGRCVIGADASSAHPIESDEEVAAAAQYNADWKAAYEYGEPNYLHIMAEELKQTLASHNWVSKVEEATVIRD